MDALEKLKQLASVLTWRDTEKWLTILYLGAQLLVMFFDPIASMAMGVFFIALLLAATSF